jgi:tRNA pseudouridine38-40 synthase
MRHADEVVIHTSARSFLHRQVRSMVGSLVEVGRGKQPVHWIGDILKAADRTLCGPVAPSDGLYLSAVGYEPLSA